MQKKKILPLVIVLLAITLLSTLGYSIYMAMQEEKPEEKIEEDKREELKDEDENSNSNNTYDDKIKAKYNYIGDNTWEYTITGYLPDPCHSLTTQVVIRESYPEQVTIKSKVSKADTICTTVVSDIDEKGIFQASENALVVFEIE